MESWAELAEAVEDCNDLGHEWEADASPHLYGTGEMLEVQHCMWCGAQREDA